MRVGRRERTHGIAQDSHRIKFRVYLHLHFLTQFNLVISSIITSSLLNTKLAGSGPSYM